MGNGNHLPFLVGTSGWNFDSWKHGFYRGVPRRAWLSHCAGAFTAIEVNGTFYRKPAPSTLERWMAETPPGFPFAAKGHRYLTHFLGLGGAAESLARQKAYMAPLAPRLAAVLWQLPERRRKDLGRLSGFLEALAIWPETSHVMEFRNETWFDAEVAALLARHNVANCISDAAAWPCWPEVTGDLAYVRLHGRPHTYASRYDDAALRRWAGRAKAWAAEGRRVHVYFDNDQDGHAPQDAIRFLATLGHSPAKRAR